MSAPVWCSVPSRRTRALIGAGSIVVLTASFLLVWSGKKSASAWDIPVYQRYASRIEGTVMRRAEDGRYAFVLVRHRPRVVVPPGQRDAARAIVGKAERDCFISASTNAEIQVDWEIVEA